MQDFPLFLQTWSLHQLASTFENTVPGGWYGDPFSFITSRDLSVVLLLIFFKLRSSPASGSYHKCPAGRHSPGLFPDFNTRLPPPRLSLSREIPSYKNYLSFGHLRHRARVEGSRTLVRAASTMWHQTQAMTFGSKYGVCFPSEQSTEFPPFIETGS